MEINPMLGVIKSKLLTINEKQTKTIGSNKKKKLFHSPQVLRIKCRLVLIQMYIKIKCSKCSLKLNLESTSLLLMESIFVSNKIILKNRKNSSMIRSLSMKNVKKHKMFTLVSIINKNSKMLGFHSVVWLLVQSIVNSYLDRFGEQLSFMMFSAISSK